MDIGDRVKEGQLLAEITAPDIDDQLAQAKANLDQAKANLTLTRPTPNWPRSRWHATRRPADRGLRQQIDQDQATATTDGGQVESAEASIQVNEATVQRFTDLQAFQKITAPFAGVITARNIDTGDLITADSTAALPLFHLAQTDVLRVFVNVPQVFATRSSPARPPSCTGGRTRAASSREGDAHGQRPGPQHAHAAHRGGCAQPGRRPAAGHVPAGGLQLSPAGSPLLIPSAAVTNRADGAWVGVLDGGNAVHYQKVELGPTSARTSRC